MVLKDMRKYPAVSNNTLNTSVKEFIVLENPSSLSKTVFKMQLFTCSYHLMTTRTAQCCLEQQLTYSQNKPSQVKAT